jgi:PAS domain S-box-containing protein
MTLDGFLDLLTQIIFLFAAGMTLFNWAKRRDQAGLDIALVFISLALVIIVQDLQDLLPAFDPFFTVVLFLALLTQPYFLLRVARYFRKVPMLVQRAAFIGLLAASATLFLIETAPILVVTVFFVYFTMVEAYASYLLIRGALTIPGITGKRLRLASIGSGLLALIFLGVLVLLLVALATEITELPESVNAVVAPLIQMLVLLSGLGYYLGFATPRWLRQYWQLSELPHFMRLTSLQKTRDRATVFEELSEAALRTVGGEAAVIAQCEADGRDLNIEIRGVPSLQIKNLELGPGLIAECWRRREASVIRLPAEIPTELTKWTERFEARSIFVIPIISPMRAWGMLIVVLRYTPLFTQDDLGMLTLLAERSVIPLDYSVLVEDALHVSEEKLVYQAHLLENVNDAVIGSDQNSIIRFWNHGAERMFGWKAEEVIGRSAREILRSEILDTDRETVLKILAETGRWKGESIQYRKDGSRVISEASSITLRDADGGLSGYVSVSRDISERKRVEEELQKAYDGLELQVQERTAALSHANALLQTLLDNMPDHIYFKDADSRFIRNSKSQARMMGLNDPTAVVGKTDFDFFPRDHAQRSYDEEQRLMKSGDSLLNMEERVIWPDGRETWVSTTKLPLRDTQNHVVGTFGISRDITERKQAEQELQRSNTQLEAANKELEAFSYSVSHDLRAPLRTIDGFSQAIMEDYGEQLPEQGRDDLNRVRKAAQHMAQLIDDLLNLSKVTRAPMKSETILLGKIAQGIIAELQRTQPGRNVKFTSHSNLKVQGDPHLLQAVLENLLNNAWKFTSKREQAEIELGSKRENEETIYFVRDNGAGFDMAYTGKLFGAFQRLHAMTDFPGTGVGLATVQRIIHRHGGRIWAEAELDLGATFFFTVPVPERAKSRKAAEDKDSIIERAREII